MVLIRAHKCATRNVEHAAASSGGARTKPDVHNGLAGAADVWLRATPRVWPEIRHRVRRAPPALNPEPVSRLLGKQRRELVEQPLEEADRGGHHISASPRKVSSSSSAMSSQSSASTNTGSSPRSLSTTW